MLPFPVELLRYFEAAAHAADPAVPRAGIPDRVPGEGPSPDGTGPMTDGTGLETGPRPGRLPLE